MSDNDAKDVEMTPTKLAAHLGVSRFAAYRKMSRIQRSHPGVIVRKGRTLVASARALAGHIDGLRPSRLELEVARLRSEVAERRGRVDALARGARP
jgi:hypothetical protein